MNKKTSYKYSRARESRVCNMLGTLSIFKPPQRLGVVVVVYTHAACVLGLCGCVYGCGFCTYILLIVFLPFGLHLRRNCKTWDGIRQHNAQPDRSEMIVSTYI